MRKKYIFAGFLLLVIISIVGYAGFFSRSVTTENKTTKGQAVQTVSVKDVSNKYLLLNPAVTASLNKHYIINVAPLRTKLFALQQKYSTKTYVYFLYLNNGIWIGLNEKDKFEAASTLKVPLAMAVLKSAENGRLALDAAYTIQDTELDGKFGELYKKGAGGEYTLRDLLQIMLEHSDNTAMNAVYNSLTRLGITDPLADIYTALGWQELEPPAFDEAPNYADINLKTLANMFLALYNAAYLSPGDSQEILGYLANTPFDDKIAAGVPEGIIVSHKIGIGGDTNTFSDCGIVYAPNRNYILCVGSNGASETETNTFIKEVSEAVYDFVINN